MSPFASVDIFPKLSGLPDFNSDPPLPFEGQEVVAVAHGWKFPDFLNNWKVYSGSDLWWVNNNKGKVITFGWKGRKLFSGLAKILISYHKEKKFSGNLVHKIRILPDLNVTHESSPVDNKEKFTNGGQLNDIKHFRWMVAALVRNHFPENGPHYREVLSKYFCLFFSEIFTKEEGVTDYYVCQLYHPIFFNSSDRFNLIGMIKDLYDLNRVAFKDRFVLKRYRTKLGHRLESDWTLLSIQHEFEYDWTSKVKRRAASNSALISVLYFKPNYATQYAKRCSGLPLYIRNVHAHFCTNKRKPFHDQVDFELNSIFPGVYAAIIDASIRDFHGHWDLFRGFSLSRSQCSPPYGWDFSDYRMTYCLLHLTRKSLLMPVEPFEANKSCSVCSKSPLTLEINTHRAKLRDFVEKIVKAKLGMYSPRIMHGEALLYEVRDDLDEAMVKNYAANLEKVLSELPSPVTSGTTVTVGYLRQEPTFNINIKHREEFDEEKEPDGMLLSGWTQASSVEKDDNKSNGNGGSTSNASQALPVEAEDNVEMDEPSTKKRRL